MKTTDTMPPPPDGWNRMPLAELEVVLWNQGKQEAPKLFSGPSQAAIFMAWLDEVLYGTYYLPKSRFDIDPWKPVARRYLMLLAKQRAQTLALLETPNP